MTLNPTIAFVPIARPTFDVPLAQEMTAKARTSLEAAGATLVAPDDLVMNDDGVQVALALLSSQTPDLLVLFQASFADSTMARQIAEKAQLPVLLWAVPEARSGGRLRLNSFCGINLAGHSLRRAGLDYDYIYAAPDDAQAIAKVQQMATAAAVASRLKTAKIGRVGENPAGFETCLFDAENLQQRLGVNVVQLDLTTIFDGSRNADNTAVDAVEQGVRGRISGYDEVNQEEARGTLATYLTLKDVAQQHDLQGIAVRCWPEFFTDLGCSACGAMSMMTNDSVPCSCEADVNGTIISLILQWISDSTAFGADLVSFDTDDDTAVLWHCGLAPEEMADPDAPVEAALHSNRQKPLLLQFPLKPGRVTVARLSEATGELRLVIGGGDMLRCPPAFSGTSGTIRFDSGAQSVMDTILHEGLEHHLSLTYGDHIETLAALANMLKLPVLRL